MSHLVRLAVALLVSTLAACGGKSSASPGDGGDGGSGAGGSTGVGGKGHAGSAAAGAASVCTSFDDDYGALVNVSISNQTGAPIYLGQDKVTCGVSPLFQVADGSGDVLPSLGNCRSPCAALRTQGVGGCPAICAFPTSVALQPNEVLYTTWDGLFSVQGHLPAKCVPSEAGGGSMLSCDQAKRIEPGTFTFSAFAGSALDCSQTTAAGACSPCSAGLNGGCSTSGSLITGPMHVTGTTVELDESYGIYPAPAPAPAPSAGDAAPAPSGSRAVLMVELIFTK